MGKEKGKEFDEWWAERSLPEKVGLGVLFAVGGLGLAFVFGLVVMALWNWLMPEIFGLTRITYWQAWGLFLLASILFKDIDFGDNDTKSDRKRKRELRRYMKENDESAADTADAGAIADTTTPDAEADTDADPGATTANTSGDAASNGTTDEKGTE